jgi:hypothetical protein
VRRRFPHATWYGQKPTFYSVIAPRVWRIRRRADRGERRCPIAALTSPRLFTSSWWLPLAQALDAIQLAVSVFADHDDWAYNDCAT